ncbi:MAG: hypothetical protein AVDCRST_MAG19-421, partial [uncultured Thermomicrobiales bacterium]
CGSKSSTTPFAPGAGSGNGSSIWRFPPGTDPPLRSAGALFSSTPRFRRRGGTSAHTWWSGKGRGTLPRCSGRCGRRARRSASVSPWRRC